MMTNIRSDDSTNDVFRGTIQNVSRWLFCHPAGRVKRRNFDQSQRHNEYSARKARRLASMFFSQAKTLQKMLALALTLALAPAERKNTRKTRLYVKGSKWADPCCCSTWQLTRTTGKRKTNKQKRIRRLQDNKHRRPISKNQQPLLCCRNHQDSAAIFRNSPPPPPLTSPPPPRRTIVDCNNLEDIAVCAETVERFKSSLLSSPV